MRRLIPTFIQDKLSNRDMEGEFPGVAMFIDLSNFTFLTESLMKQGNEGAEKLSNYLNKIFDPLVHHVYLKGGFIPYFAGDAFTAIFEIGTSEEDIILKVLDTAVDLITLFDLERENEGPLSIYKIGIKIGISMGSVKWGIVGNHKKAFYFRGDPILSSAKCQSFANEGEIVIDKTIVPTVLQTKLTKLEKGFYLFHNLPKNTPPSNGQFIHQPDLQRTIAEDFLPKEVLDLDQAGEFRPVVSVFLAFKGAREHKELFEFTSIILDLADVFSGYFKEIDFGDKGGVMVVFFGAPVAFENNIKRALEFASSIQSSLKEKSIGKLINVKIGITSGMAFTGIIGGEERCQYAAVGNYINLAARLMVNASWGEILVDEEVQRERHFRFEHRGDIEYKGFENSMPTYHLIGHRTNEVLFSGKLVGREAELEQLFNFALPILQKEFAGVAVVFGEAGIGKSRIAFELNKKLGELGDISWFVCQSDQILRKSFNPFIYFLKNYFQQSPENSKQTNLLSFESAFEELLEKSMRNSSIVPTEFISELNRTKTVLAGLIGIDYENSLWKQLDAKGRYRNTFSALLNFFLIQSQHKPLVVMIEDAHWYDADSITFLQEFLKKAKNFPVFFLLTSRYNDEGARKLMLEQSFFRMENISYVEVDLNLLSAEAVKTFAEDQIKGELEESFLALLQRMTNGNPFYLEQIIEYFTESGLLEKKNGKWSIQNQNIKLNSSINAILTARIDRLSTLVKETVKAAAVIGREFEVPVLNEVMKYQESFLEENGDLQNVLKDQVKSAVKGQIWSSLNELRYIFKHSLLREAVYDMQLRARLRELHSLTAKAIERLYEDSLEEHYPELAFHYEQAGMEQKTIEYLDKSADYAKRNFQNQNAIEYYDKLLAYLDKEAAAERANTLLKKGSVLELIGDWEECERNLTESLDEARLTGNKTLIGRAHNSLGHFSMLRGNYKIAQIHLSNAARFFEETNDKVGIIKVNGNLGNLYFRQGEYEQAKAFFQKSIRISITEKLTTSIAEIAANLGLTYMNQGRYKEGIQAMRAQLKVADKQGSAVLYTNLGILYFEQSAYEESLECYERGLSLSKELGDKHLMAIATGSMGSIYQRRGDFDKAMQYFKEDLKICEELGDKQGISIAFGLIGELYSVIGEFESANDFLTRNLALSRELGYQKGIAKALNTLGDVANFTGNYRASVDYYNEAVSISKNINNKLILAFSFMESAYPLIKLNLITEAEEAYNKACSVAQSLDNQDLLFELEMLFANILSAKGEKENAINHLEALLPKAETFKGKAFVNYYLWKVSQNNYYREKAHELLEELVEINKEYFVKKYYEEVKSAG